MQATAIIPVKRFGAAKQRLLEALDRPQRAAVVKAMLADVLAALDGAESIERVIIVTGEGRAERLALEHARRSTTPLEVMQDPDDHGHSEAATLGIIRALSHGAEATALLPGDCPLLDPAELDAAFDRMRPGRVAVVPDRHGTGTNALLLAPGDAIGPAFGEGSCARHRERAERAGHEVAVEELDSLALDLDTPDDLAELGPGARPRARSERRQPRPSSGGSRSWASGRERRGDDHGARGRWRDHRRRPPRGAPRGRIRARPARPARRRHRRRLAEGRLEGGGTNAGARIGRAGRPGARARRRSRQGPTDGRADPVASRGAWSGPPRAS